MYCLISAIAQCEVSSIGQWWNAKSQGKSERNPSQCYSVLHKSHMNIPEARRWQDSFKTNYQVHEKVDLFRSKYKRDVLSVHVACFSARYRLQHTSANPNQFINSCQVWLQGSPWITMTCFKFQTLNKQLIACQLASHQTFVKKRNSYQNITKPFRPQELYFYVYVQYFLYYINLL